MPVVHYRPRVAVAVPPVTVTKVVATTKPATHLPATVVKPSAPVVVSVAKTAATTKVVIPTKATASAAASAVRSIALPLTSSIAPSTTQLSSETTPSTTPATVAKVTAAPGTLVASHTTTSASASASPSASLSPSSSSSTSVVATGIIGGLAGVILTGLLVAFFFRRWNRDRRTRSRSHDSMNFDAKTFRRSAVMLDNDSPPPPRVPEFSSGTNFRSVPMGYHGHQTLIVQHQYPYTVHAPPSHRYPYSPDTPTPSPVGGYSTPEYPYPISSNPFYIPPGVQQGYPPESHRQSIRSAREPPTLSQAPHYHYQNEHNEDAYGGM
ncbi:hypothetical protein K438DRAFT_1841374 [Mycena galopus ATCC 62051]|nr:hypothetical protein K438DRAFT_1841374 [Mycena galopus ATCC 62051]